MTIKNTFTSILFSCFIIIQVISTLPVHHIPEELSSYLARYNEKRHLSYEELTLIIHQIYKGV